MSVTEDNLGAALRDFALDQIADADLQLARAGAWQHEGVHLARKAIARLRACIELLHKSPLGTLTLERRLRGFAHGLSPLRDTQAALATAKELGKKQRKAQRLWQQLAGELKERRDRVLGAALMADPGFAARRAQLAELRASVATLAWTRLLDSDVAAAVKRADKRVGKAAGPARSSKAELPRHRLRRRSRRLLLQIEMLRAIAHDAARPRAAATAQARLHERLGKSLQRKQRKQLIERLGWEQDLRVLRRALPARATSASTRRAIAHLFKELNRAQAATNTSLE
jgi:hypothetical protein